MLMHEFVAVNCINWYIDNFSCNFVKIKTKKELKFPQKVNSHRRQKLNLSVSSCLIAYTTAYESPERVILMKPRYGRDAHRTQNQITK